MTKAAICTSCMDVVSPSRLWAGSTSRPWRWCSCDTVGVRWRDGQRGTLEVTAPAELNVRVLGMNNEFLQEGIVKQRSDEEWRDLHTRQGHAPGYLFDASRRDCWALIVRVGESSDVFFMDCDEAREASRQTMWDQEAETIRARMQAYEDEHPDEAICLPDLVIDIDGTKFKLQEV